MDLSKETNVEKLKALAYEQVVALETAQANLRAIQQRIAQLEAVVEPVVGETIEL